jgi:hypothetical protein
MVPPFFGSSVAPLALNLTGDDSSMTDISAAGSQICQCCTSSSNELSLPTIDEAIHQEPPSSPPLLPDDATSPLLPDDAFAIFDFDMASSIHMQSEQYKGSTDISSEVCFFQWSRVS